MSGIVQRTDSQVVSAAAERVRLSFLGGRTQVDIALPLDAPIALLAPQAAKLLRSREAQGDTADDALSKDVTHETWVLTRHDDKKPLPPNITLREAGVTDGELLRLTAQRNLT